MPIDREGIPRKVVKPLGADVQGAVYPAHHDDSNVLIKTIFVTLRTMRISGRVS